METSDDYIHKISNKTIYVGKTKKEWIELPVELGKKKCKVIEDIEINCLCKKHKTTLYVLKDTQYSTFNCMYKGWCWINVPTDLKIVKETLEI